MHIIVELCATLYSPSPLQHCTARSIAQRPALHCTEHSEPRQGRSQRANQAYTERSAKQYPALHSAQRYTALHSAQRFTAPSASLRPALHCAQRYTAPSVAQCATLYPPPEPCIARSIAQRPALHCTEHSEPRQGRMQQPNHRLRKGGSCVFFVVRTPDLAPCAKRSSVQYSAH